MKIVGHRGARGLAPENTIVGLKKALEYSVDEIEFDIRVTKDNIVILHHDARIHDPNGATLLIKDTNYDELLQHKPDLATFTEVLKQFGKVIPLYIEVKPGEPTQPIINVTQDYLTNGGSTKHVQFASFSQSILVEIHTALPNIGLIINENWSGARATYRARKLGTKRLSMSALWLWRPFIQPMSRRGWKLYAYTVNDPKKAQKWASYGLSGVITDYPDLFNT